MAEIDKMHSLMKEYNLNKEFWWICTQTDRVLNGELYCCIANSHGAFVQPALYEGFGLTVIEPMTCGLPTFATCHGGPKEIVENEKSGLDIDPYNGDGASKIMVDFFERCTKEEDYWSKFSDVGLEWICTKYTWEIYAEQLLTLSRVYGFWKYVSELGRRETRLYLEMFYILKFRELVKTVLVASDDKSYLKEQEKKVKAG